MMNYLNNISFKADSCSGVSTTNLLEKYKNQNSFKGQPEDKITICKDLIADMEYWQEKAALGTYVKGYINGKPSALKVVTNHENESWFEGFVDKNYVLLHRKDKNYVGKYGNSDLNIVVNYNEPSKISNFFNEKLLGKSFIPDYFTVQGNIGNKIIDITLPDIKVPTDEDVKNVLTMILEDNGLKAQTINGEVKSLKFAPSAIKNIKKRAEKREKTINNDIKPIFMQGISTATGMVIGSMVSAMLFKFGLKK